MTDPRPREQMTPEALAHQMETWQGWTRPRREAAAAHLRRLAALEREAEVWAATSSRAEEKIAALEQEKEVLENAWAGLSAENTRLREALHVIRITGPEREHEIAREALAGAPDEESDA
jgi:hypothetical protein